MTYLKILLPFLLMMFMGLPEARMSGVIGGDMPVASVTPGATNPAVTQANIKQTICVPGFTKTIRPPATYTTKLKLQQLRSGPYKGKGGAADVEEDHLIPLTVGGHPTDHKNLWPQLWDSAKKKDKLEVLANKLVCSGKVPLTVMQQAIATDWVAALNKYGWRIP